MPEPVAAPAVESLSSEQATAEIAQIRGNVAHDWHHEGRPGFDAANERVMQLYQRAHASPAPKGAPGAAPPDETARRPNIVDDGPHATPQTAAELDAVPLLGGLDPEISRAANAAAERAGVTAMVLEGRHVIAQARSAGTVDFATLESRLETRYGRALPSKLDAFFTALDDPDFPPALRADLERTGLDLNDEVFDYLARMGESMLDATTPDGERRLRARYAEATKQP